MTSFRDAFWFDPHDSFLLLPDSSALTVLPQPHVLGMVGDLAPAASGVTVGTPTALGSYAEGVLAGMGLEPRLLARIRRCYDHGTLHTPGLKGRVVVHFDINRLGEMSKLAAGPESTLRDADTAACVVHSFEGMAFARPAFGSASVIVPIDLAPAR
jgi:hypothetical protein